MLSLEDPFGILGAAVRSLLGRLVCLLLACWAGTALAFSTEVFYLWRLRRQVLPHLFFVAACLAWATLFLFGVIGVWAFALGTVFLSFRVTGSYVLSTVAGRPYTGMDWSVPGWLAAVAAIPFIPDAVSLFGWTARDVLPWLFVGWLALANLREFAAELEDLRAPARGR